MLVLGRLHNFMLWYVYGPLNLSTEISLLATPTTQIHWICPTKLHTLLAYYFVAAHVFASVLSLMCHIIGLLQPPQYQRQNT